MKKLVSALMAVLVCSGVYGNEVPEVHCYGAASNGEKGVFLFELNKKELDEYWDRGTDSYVPYTDYLNTFRVTQRAFLKQDRLVQTPPTAIGGGFRCQMKTSSFMTCNIDAFGNDFHVLKLEIDLNTMVGTGSFKSRTSSIVGSLSGGDIYAEFDNLECNVVE